MNRWQMAVLSAAALAVMVESTNGPGWWIAAVVPIGFAAGWLMGRKAHR